MKSADKNILAILKLGAKPNLSPADREKVRSQTSKAVAEMKESPARAALPMIMEYFQTCDRMAEIGQPLTPPLKEILSLGQFGYVESAGYAWTHAGDAVSDAH